MVRWIAAYLDVELHPWQDRFLRKMLAEHRQPDPPEVEVRLPDRPTCDMPHPTGNARCVLPVGHSYANHETIGGFHWPV